MARIFITGSSDGIGAETARQLKRLGHSVTLHARNAARAKDAARAVPGADKVLVGDLSLMREIHKLAEDANAVGTFDAVIHNAGIYEAERGARSADGLPLLFAVNTLASYMLTALMKVPQRLVYLSSMLHLQGAMKPERLDCGDFQGMPSPSYADTKLFVVMLAKAAARDLPHTLSNAVNPGWVATRMGGAGAPDTIAQGAATPAWLAVSDDRTARVTGKYFHNKKEARSNPAADDVRQQMALLDACAAISGVSWPSKK